MLRFNELGKIECEYTSQQEAGQRPREHPQTLTTLVKTGANLDKGDVQQPLVVGEAEEILEAEVAIETTALVPQVVLDRRVQEEVGLDRGVLKGNHPKWTVRMPASTVAKMDTRYASVSKIQTTNASTVGNLDTLHAIAMSVRNLEDAAEADGDLGKVAVEDEDVVLFEGGKVERMWGKQNLPRKKIPLRQ